MGYNITKTNWKPQFVIDLMEKQAKLPFIHEVDGADEIRVGRDCKKHRGLTFSDKQPVTDR